MRVTFWEAHGSACLIVEHDGGKLCHVTRHPAEYDVADQALIKVLKDADLLVFPGDWAAGLALKQRASVKLLAIAPDGAATDVASLAQAAAEKSANVFFVLGELRLEL
jgi:hypothetical protein